MEAFGLLRVGLRKPGRARALLGFSVEGAEVVEAGGHGAGPWRMYSTKALVLFLVIRWSAWGLGDEGFAARCRRPTRENGLHSDK